VRRVKVPKDILYCGERKRKSTGKHEIMTGQLKAQRNRKVIQRKVENNPQLHAWLFGEKENPKPEQQGKTAFWQQIGSLSGK
jgi:hypothetical protein